MGAFLRLGSETYGDYFAKIAPKVSAIGSIGAIITFLLTLT